MKLILNGGGDGKAAESARQLLNSVIDHSRKILYIPLAWPDPTYRGCLEFMTGELSDVDKAGIDMVRSAVPDFKIREAEDTSNKSTGRTAESKKKRTEREGGWNG